MIFKMLIFSILLVPFLTGRNNSINNFNNDFRKPQPTNKEKIARAIVNNLATGDFEAATVEFTDTLKRQLTPAMMRGPWMNLVAQAGAFTAILSAQENQTESYNQVVVFCKFENGNAVVQVIFNQEEKVTGVFLKPV